MADDTLKPEVSDSLLGDAGILSLMSQPKMVAAIQAMKEDPRRYHELIAQDDELAEMMAALKGAMASAEAAHAAPPEVSADALRARELAHAAMQRCEHRVALDNCERGLRTATGELARELGALRDRAGAGLAAEEARQVEAAVLTTADARRELIAAIAAADERRLQAAVDAARAGGLVGEAVLADGQRLLVKLLEARSGARMRQMREEANRAAAHAAAAPPKPAETAPQLAAAPVAAPRAEPQSDSPPLPAAVAEPPALPSARVCDTPPIETRPTPAVDPSVRAAVLASPLLFELD
jgi:hypothetical protein